MANAGKINFVFFNEATTTTTSPILNIHGDYITANLDITGTATSFEMVLEGQVINDVWTEIGVTNVTTFDVGADITAKGITQASLIGFTKVRAKIKAIAGGNLTVKARVVG